jgi:apolipoprotein N-acyltransferase
VSIALCYGLINTTKNAKAAFKLGWSYGFGVFAVGASWVYVSIHDYGYAPVPLALIMTGLFTFLLGLFFGLQTWLYKKWFSQFPALNALSFAIIWVLFEWFRSWFLTGFPWLYLGYGHIHSWLSGWAPIFGVFGVSLIVSLSSTTLFDALRNKACGRPVYGLVLVLLLWPIGALLNTIHWTDTKTELSVTLMQGNIPQEKKWQKNYRPVSLNTYRQLNRNANSDLIIWPETAVPYFKHQISGWLKETERLLKPGQGLITGIPYYDEQSDPESPVLHNTIIGLGAASGQYHKQKLVPFGEYVPMQGLLRGLIQFFNLPMSNFRPGPSHQAPLLFNGLSFLPAICYEIAYPSFIAQNMQYKGQQQDFIITISNDAWFGDSIGPKQHLQIAQMRALETSRYVLRSTNTGLTAVINEKGEITYSLPDFIEGGLNAKVMAQEGLTPYSRWLNYPILALILFTLIGIRLFQRFSQAQKA